MSLVEADGEAIFPDMFPETVAADAERVRAVVNCLADSLPESQVRCGTRMI